MYLVYYRENGQAYWEVAIVTPVASEAVTSARAFHQSGSATRIIDTNEDSDPANGWDSALANH